MGNLITICLLLSSTLLWSQGNYLDHLQENIPSYSLMFVGGMANGATDVLQHHYSQSLNYFQTDPEYWNPKISWQNKYRDWPIDTRPAYPGAKTWLAWTTDGWHLGKTIQLKSMQLAVVTFQPNIEQRKWWWPVADLTINSILFSTGWHISNHFLIKPEYR